MELDDFKYAYFKRWGVQAYMNFFKEKPPIRFGRTFAFLPNVKADYDA